MTHHIQTTFGRQLFTLFRYQTDIRRANFLSQRQHFLSDRDLQIHARIKRFGQQPHITLLDMTAVLTQVDSNAIGPRFLGQQRCLNRIRITCATRLTQCGNVVDVDTEQNTQRMHQGSPNISVKGSDDARQVDTSARVSAVVECPAGGLAPHGQPLWQGRPAPATPSPQPPVDAMYARRYQACRARKPATSHQNDIHLAGRAQCPGQWYSAEQHPNAQAGRTPGGAVPWHVPGDAATLQAMPRSKQRRRRPQVLPEACGSTAHWRTGHTTALRPPAVLHSPALPSSASA